MDGFAFSRGVVTVATVAVGGKDASQTEESGSEFHGRRASWIGTCGCFGGTEFPHHLIQ